MNRSSPFLPIAVGLLVLCAFAWGYLTHERGTFPDALIQSTLVELGWRREPPPRRIHPERSLVDEKALLSLPYLSASPDTAGGRRGVSLHEPDRTFPGLNLYSSERESRAFLLTMEGQLVHHWSHQPGGFQHVELLPDGDLMVLIKDDRLLRLGKDSSLVWEFVARVHHDLWFDEASQNIWVLTRKPKPAPERHATIPILVDYLTILSPDGHVLREIDLLDSLEGSPFAFLLPSVEDLIPPGDETPPAIDLLHTNHVEIIEFRTPALPEAFQRGNILVSLRNLNAIAVLDSASGDLLWAWGPNNLILQHHPTLLPSGNLLIFDNRLEESRVVEIDPSRPDSSVWQYGPAPGFFSRLRGSNQRLPNGNTLITESDEGRVIEVTPEGDVVWEFFNHDLDAEGLRGPIWRMRRIGFDDPSLASFDLPPAG